MSKPFSIKSTRSDRELIFTDLNGEYFNVELRGSINTSLRIYRYEPHRDDLVGWFNDLGLHSTPWENELVWESLEGEFKIKVECTSLGHVHFTIDLRDLNVGHEDTYIQAGIETELGQLTYISNRASQFFPT